MSAYWTREEREAYRYELTPWEAVSHDGSDDFTVTPEMMRRILATVDALEDTVDALLCAAPSTEVFDMRPELDNARALLAALEGKP